MSQLIDRTYTFDQLPAIADAVVSLLDDEHKVITLTGPLGAGKTTLVNSVLERKGIKQPITSPTFTYVNVYENPKGELFYHFDLYRLSGLDEFVEAGFDELLYLPNSWAFIEWPEMIMPLLKKKVCHLTLEYGEHQEERALNVVCK